LSVAHDRRWVRHGHPSQGVDVFVRRAFPLIYVVRLVLECAAFALASHLLEVDSVALTDRPEAFGVEFVVPRESDHVGVAASMALSVNISSMASRYPEKS